MAEKETLVVISKVKKLIKEEGGMNTSGNATDALSELVRQACMKGVENARMNNRKTVMDRDFE